MAASVEVGTVFVRNWGYDQSNVNYYEVVSVSPSGKTAKAKAIKAASAGGDRVVPATGEGRFVEKASCTRCSNWHEGPGWDGHAFSDEYTWQSKHDWIKVTYYGDHAYRWDGKPDYVTAFGFGH